MNAFYKHHQDSIRFSYRCFDRILLNGLIQPFQQPERVVGFFNTYRQLYPVSRDVLRDIAGQFQNWVKNRSESWGAPILEAPQGRRDDFVEPYFRKAKPDQVVVILKAREPARILIAIGNKNDNRWHLQIAQRWVMQYNFYVNDRNWGRMFVRLCPYFPFSARVCLNQHHWLAQRLQEQKIDFQQCSNAFRKCSNPSRLQELADSLSAHDLLTCGQKWLTRFTPFFTDEERKQAACQHRLFFAQVEYCDNLIFRRRAALDQLGERLLDANRAIGQPNKITVIFGRKITPRYRGKLQTVIEDIDLPNPVIRSHYGHGFIKQYVRDHLLLRTESATNNVADYAVKKAVADLPQLRLKLSSIVDNYLDIQQDILETFLDRGQLRNLSQPTILPNGKRIPGLKLDHPRPASPDACLGALLAHRCGEYIYHRGTPPTNRRGSGLLHPGLPPLLVALRPVETQNQGPGRETSTLQTLSTPAARLLDLPRLSQTLRAHLRPAHRRAVTTLFPGQQTSTKPPISA
jgi:hypothetical protein